MHRSRRDFLEQAFGMAATALAAVPAAPARTEEIARDTCPNEKIRVAVIGVNGQGGSHLEEWMSNPDCRQVAVCDCDPNAFAKQEKRFRDRNYPRPDYEQDVRRLLARQDIDAVSIATPNHWHALMAVWAMQSGKDVYVEKPCSHNVEEGRVITNWARKLGRMCQMGVQSRSMPGMRQTIEFVRSGGVGPVKVAHALCYKPRNSIGLVYSPVPLPEGIDFDLWAGPAPAERPIRERLHYDWHWNRLTGNGDLGNQNPHELDKARWGLGMQSLPKRVVRLGGRLGYVDNGDVANSQLTVFQWDDALLISDVRGLAIKSPVTFDLAAGPLRVGNIWWGTDGYVVAPSYTSGVAFDYDGKQLGAWSGGSYQNHFANFVKAIKSRRHEDLHLDIEDGHLSSALAHLGNVSWALGKPVDQGARPTLADDNKQVQETLASFDAHLAENDVDYSITPLALGRFLRIDPETETSDDPEANRLFSREYRKGFELPTI